MYSGSVLEKMYSTSVGWVSCFCVIEMTLLDHQLILSVDSGFVGLAPACRACTEFTLLGSLILYVSQLRHELWVLRSCARGIVCNEGQPLLMLCAEN